MKNIRSSAAAIVAAAALSACTSGQSAIEPGFSAVDYTKSGSLVFSTGTATIGTAGGSVTGLNVAATFRKSDGTSAFAVSTPVITGPAGFIVPASTQAKSDAGTAHISGTPQGGTAKTTFGTSGSVFAYGFQPSNYGTGGNPASFAPYTQPFYLDADANAAADFPLQFGASPDPNFAETLQFVGGPPAFPAVTGASTSSFPGYNLGFLTFLAKPVSGAFTLGVTVTPANSAPFTYSATSTLNASTVLPVFAPPTVTAAAGGSATITAVPPAGVTEAIVEIFDVTSGKYFTVKLSGGAGTLPAGSFASGDNFQASAVGFDYPQLEADYPSVVQTPVLANAAGQSDVTISYPSTGTAP